jgi:membrane protease YdiL (CAAX protease family)
MTPTLTELEPTEAPPSWLGDHPIAGSVAITVLTGVALQLTHMIDFQDRVAEVVGWNVSVRFIDFGFRTILGALVVLAVLPWLFGHTGRRGWLGSYLRYLRLNSGPVPHLTYAGSAMSVFIMLALITSLAAGSGAFRAEPDFVLEESRWFVLILALVPAIWEELAFRGLMLSNLQWRFRPWVAILGSSALFGLFHVSNLLLRDLGEVVPEMILATVMSVGWGYLVVKTNSVIPAMVSHYFVNVFIELLLDPDLSESAGGAIFGSLTIIYPLLTVVAVWALCRRNQEGAVTRSP